MAFQGEDVTLTKDVILKKDKEFIQTESEWSARELGRKQIIGEIQRSIDGSDTLYTVPQNHEFFLTSAAITLSHQNGTATVGAFLRIIRKGISSPSNLIDIFKLEIEGHLNIATQSLSFPMPIRLTERDVIILRYDEDATAVGESKVFFCGWEESKRIS